MTTCSNNTPLSIVLRVKIPNTHRITHFSEHSNNGSGVSPDLTLKRTNLTLKLMDRIKIKVHWSQGIECSDFDGSSTGRELRARDNEYIIKLDRSSFAGPRTIDSGGNKLIVLFEDEPG